MALFKRGSESERADRAVGPEAVYARVIDGEQLWLAVRGEGPLVLRGHGVDDLELPTEPAADAQGPLITSRFPIAAAIADVDATELELRLLAEDLPVIHAAPAPQGPGLAEPLTRDRRWHIRVGSADGEVSVRRDAVPPTIAVLAFGVSDEGVEILLNTEADRAELVVDGERIADFLVDDSVLRLAALPTLAVGATAVFQVRGDDVVRSENALARPMAAVALPPLPESEVTLRWTPEARLSVRREERS